MRIELRDIALAYGGEQALTDISFHLAAGERVAIIGSSGAGKTSLLRLLATAQKPERGLLHLLDSSPWHLSGRARQHLRTRIGLIHQAPPLPPRQRVVTAVAAGRLGQWSLARSLLNLLYPLDPGAIGELLARFDLGERLFARCHELSGGELQRIGIVRVLYQAPELILADEPVSAMDPVLAEHTLALLNDEARQRGITLVASLHAVELALRHFPRIIGLRAGRILFDKPASEVLPQDLDALYANSQLRASTETAGSVLRTAHCGGVA